LTSGIGIKSIKYVIRKCKKYKRYTAGISRAKNVILSLLPFRKYKGRARIAE
jgi:hypothetical protein